jgi:Zn finger protein HypA/HybF involved in hydrogenase expression
MAVMHLHRTLDQELLALARGASLECLVCGEFVLHEDVDVVCRECGSRLPALLIGAGPALDWETQAG